MPCANVLCVFSDCGDSVAALDVQPHAAQKTVAQARGLLQQMGTHSTLVLTDLFGATPCSAQRLVDGVGSRLVAGVNLPMLLRAVSYRAEPLDIVVPRCRQRHRGCDAGGHCGAQNQTRRNSMIKTHTTINNKLGLHARASAN